MDALRRGLNTAARPTLGRIGPAACLRLRSRSRRCCPRRRRTGRRGARSRRRRPRSEPSLPASNVSPSSPVISPVDERLRRVRGEVAEVGRVPQRERGDGAVLDVLAHLVRRAEAGQRDLALELRRREVARRSRDADRRGRDDALQVGVGLQQRRGLVERRLVVVVAVDGLDELDVGVVRRRAPPPSSRSRRSGWWRWPSPTGSRSDRRRRSARRSGRPGPWRCPPRSAWLMNRSRHSGLVSESKVTTLTPASRASSSASQMASGSFAETTSAADALLRRRS